MEKYLIFGVIMQVSGVILFFTGISFDIFLLVQITNICFFLNIPVLNELGAQTPSRHIGISAVVLMIMSAVFAVMMLSMMALAIIYYPVLLLLYFLIPASAIYLFLSFAFAYKKKSVTIGAIINTALLSVFIILCVLAIIFTDGVWMILAFFITFPLLIITFIVFYFSLLIAKIYPKTPIAQKDET
jgi:hypothetical protein